MSTYTEILVRKPKPLKLDPVRVSTYFEYLENETDTLIAVLEIYNKSKATITSATFEMIQYNLKDDVISVAHFHLEDLNLVSGETSIYKKKIRLEHDTKDILFSLITASTLDLLWAEGKWSNPSELPELEVETISLIKVHYPLWITLLFTILLVISIMGAYYLLNGTLPINL